MNIKYRPFEMHCHTLHSDGRFSVEQLLRAAAECGYDGLCLTDHNTMSGMRELAQTGRTEPFVMPGIEWTTYYGHLLVLGGNRFVDWRFVTPDSIDGALLEIRESGGIAGVAHPFEMGAPLSCGSCWEFRVTRWDLVQYMEVWSSFDPHKKRKNQLALPLYEELLNAGYHIAVTAGRDWHGPDQGERHVLSATYLGLEDGRLTREQTAESLLHGRTYVTLGPELRFSIRQNGLSFGLGDTVSAGPVEIRAEAVPGKRGTVWTENGAHVLEVRLVVNGMTAAVSEPGSCALRAELALPEGWARLEAWGILEGSEQRLAMTSPVYIGT